MSLLENVHSSSPDFWHSACQSMNGPPATVSPSAGCAAPVVTAGLMARIPFKTSAIRSCPCRLVQNHPPQDGSWRGGLRSLGRLWFHSRMTCDPCLTLRSMHLAARRVHAFLCSHVHVLIAQTLVPKKTLLLCQLFPLQLRDPCFATNGERRPRQREYRSCLPFCNGSPKAAPR